MLVLTLFAAYVAVAAGFYALLTRSAVEHQEEGGSMPMLYVVEGGAIEAQKRAA
ncbi:MAG: hypothetical protein ABUL49_01560 [bacterium]